ncbi:MAG: Mrp/NBP35 family ATP-binding protein [Acidimicrobiales bacterium]
MTTPGPATSEESVRGALLGVIDPELGDNIVDLGMVRSIVVEPNGDVVVGIALTIAGCPLRTQLNTDIRGRISSLPGVGKVEIEMAEMNPDERQAVMARARWKARESAPTTDIPSTARVVAIASGKGGVGKSSVTVNLAVALARRGLTVGLLDADIGGFSVPRMLGLSGEIQARDGKMLPLEKVVRPGLVKVLSMGFLAEEDSAIMWRGLLLNRAVQQFLEDVWWGEMDYLLIDMPPGTSDIQMGLARMLPRTEMIIVTTPPLAAQKVASRTADMARKGYLRVAGVIENMSSFVCDHGDSYELFGSGGGQRLADDIGVPLIGSIPIDPALARGGDLGRPLAEGDGPTAQAFAALATRLVTEIAPLVEMSGCSVRLLEAVDRAVGSLDSHSPLAEETTDGNGRRVEGEKRSVHAHDGPVEVDPSR